MRNLAEHPITSDDLLEYIDRLTHECDPNLVGDLRPLMLAHLRRMVLENKPTDSVARSIADMLRKIVERSSQDDPHPISMADALTISVAADLLCFLDTTKTS